MQNVTHIAPAIAAFFFTQTIVGFAGGHAPLAYLIGFLIVLALGMCLVQLAKRFPSAGGYYTYVSRTVGPGIGFNFGVGDTNVDHGFTYFEVDSYHDG